MGGSNPVLPCGGTGKKEGKRKKNNSVLRVWSVASCRPEVPTLRTAVVLGTKSRHEFVVVCAHSASTGRASLLLSFWPTYLKNSPKCEEFTYCRCAWHTARGARSSNSTQRLGQKMFDDGEDEIVLFAGALFLNRECVGGWEEDDVFLVYFYLCMPFAEVLPRQERTVITNLEDTEGLLLLETLDVLGLVGDHVETDGLGKRPGYTNANW